MVNNDIQSRVAASILEEPLTVNVGEKTFKVAPPSLATLILVSEAISRLPSFTLDPNKLVQECFHIAKDCRLLGDLAALLILGAQRSEKKTKRAHTGVLGFIRGIFKRRRTEREALADEILKTLSPRELFTLISRILSSLQLSDFFGLTTFLTEINLLHQTKVEN